MKVQKQIRSKAFQAGEGFIRDYQRLVKETVLPYQYAVLCDEIEGAEKSHVRQNFINAGKALRGEDVGDGFYGMVFQDSDAAKWLEAVAYSLAAFPDKELEAEADELISLIAQAQDEDGYLNTYFTIKDREKRWTNLLEGHELYCAGHMMEAAVAYYEATGKDVLLNVMRKNAQCIYKHFVTEGAPGYAGHPEVELALMRMYSVTGEEYLAELAKHFIDVRGVDSDYFVKEVAGRSWSVWGSDGKDTRYNQANRPVREMSDATGHAVRAVYLYTAMADVAAQTEDEELSAACRRLWESITKRQMYLTGGIGSTVHGEAFSVDYDLPGDTAYAETCASIGLMFFASKLLEQEVSAEYADVMERAFYNTVLAGMQLDGKRFFYVNPLEVVPGISGVAQTHRHDLPERPGWYACACCPPNVARVISSFGSYAYGEAEETAYCHLYAAGNVDFANGLNLVCETAYPYGFTVDYRVTAGAGKLAFRIPGWSKTWSVEKGGVAIEAEPIGGYVTVEVAAGDTVRLVLDDKPYYVYPSSRVPRLSGSIAVCRGPLVYCFEGVDNDGDVLGISLTEAEIEVSDYCEELLGGTVVLQTNALREQPSDELYCRETPKTEACVAKAVPYYTWGNRGKNQMRVWMNRR